MNYSLNIDISQYIKSKHYCEKKITNNASPNFNVTYKEENILEKLRKSSFSIIL